MILSRFQCVALLLIAGQVLAGVAGAAHRHAHEPCGLAAGHADHGHAGHDHATSGCAEHGHRHDSQPADSPDDADTSLPYHDHDHCNLCKLLSQAADCVSMDLCPPNCGLVVPFDQAKSTTMLERVLLSYRSRAPPVAV